MCAVCEDKEGRRGSQAESQSRRADDSQAELIDKIKERWAYDQNQQGEIQKVLANRAAKHEITN